MSSNNWPVFAVAAFGIVFILLAAFWPQLNWYLGIESPRSGQRLLSTVLGLALLAVFGIWYAATLP